MPTRTKFLSRKNGRIERVKKRQEETNLLTHKQRLERLDSKLGVGIGATKERKRLQKTMSHSKLFVEPTEPKTKTK